MNPDHVAQCAQLAMLIELSSGPKPGNVDRCHDHYDIGFRHFLVSATSAYPVFRKAAAGEGGIGSLTLEAVAAWRKWGLKGNTHFGELALLIPLARAAGRKGDLREELLDVLEKTTVEDALCFYRAFELSGARVADVKELSMADPSAIEELRKRRTTLLELMRLSEGHDVIAREWSTGFERSFGLSETLHRSVEAHGINDGVVFTFLEALASEPDTLVQAKFGRRKAVEVSSMAKAVLRSDEPLKLARVLDQLLLAEGVNPGSTADLIAASLFIALLYGMRL